MADQFSMGYALLIGVDENKVESMALPAVARDVAALEQVLVHPQRCAYPAQNVKTITGAEATRDGMLAGLDWLHAKIEADTTGHATAVVYFTGHGWRDQAGDGEHYYLIPYDLQERHFGLSALPAVNFAEAIDGLRPRRLLVILDCCHAGGMGAKSVPLSNQRYTAAALPPQLFMGGEKGVDDSGVSKGLDRLAQGSGRAVLSSSQGSQLSYLRLDTSMSIFTYHLIEALSGHAQPADGAKEVLVSDVMGYVFRKVPASARLDANAVQEPGYQVSGNFPVALLLGGKGLSKGQRAPDPLATPEIVDALQRVDTGGGAYIAGHVSTGGGDFIGRDKVVHGDEVRGNKIDNRGGFNQPGWQVGAVHQGSGDIQQTSIGGDQVTTGDISGTGTAVGRGAQAHVTQGTSAADLGSLFAQIYTQIEHRTADPDVEKDEIVHTVKLIEAEAGKGEQANPTRVERWLRILKDIAPDVLEVTAQVLTNPVGGVAEGIRRVAAHLR